MTFDPPVEAERSEWFLRGTEMAAMRGNAGQGLAGSATPTIRYPAADTIIALDPDIPSDRERVVFSASPAVPGLQWRIDDVVLIAERGRVDWKPVPGQHVLVLEDAEGKPLSTVKFEVRGGVQ